MAGSKKVPGYRLHRPSGRAYVALNGRQIYLGKYGSPESHAEYDRLIAEWLAGGRDAAPGAKPPELRIGTLCARYIVWCEEYYVKDGQQTDEVGCVRSALRDLLALFQHLPVSQFGPVALSQVRDRMIEKGNSRRYINKQIGRIRRMFRWGAERQWFPVEVYLALQTLSGLKKGRTAAIDHPEVMPVEEWRIEKAIGQMDRGLADLVRFQWLTGCRPGEARSVRPMDVNCGRFPWEYVPSSHKMQHRGRNRIVLVGTKAQEVLRPYLAGEPSGWCFTRDGDQWTRDRYRSAIHKACKDAKVEPWNPNQLRHTAATEIRRRYGLEAAQVILGHVSADVTQVYAERDLATARKVAIEWG